MAENISKHLADSFAYYDSRVDKEIERNRKGDLSIVLIGKDGNPSNEKYKITATLDCIDFNFGANIFMLGEYEDQIKNAKYEEKFLKLFNAATVPLYWSGTEPREGYLRYDADTPRDQYRRPPADLVVDYCKKHNLKMKGHPLFWHEFLPKWLPTNYEMLKPYIVKRFEEIAERYAKCIPLFDVVNEPSRIFDVYMRDRYKDCNAIVPEDDYCVWLFALARQYFPAAKLILNDTVEASFTDFRGKYSGYYLNIKDLLGRGVPIDEIGLQCHCGAMGPANVYNSERLLAVLDTYAELGKPINISEIAIPSKIDNVENEALQAEAAERLYKAAFSHAAVTGVTWWNLPDDGIIASKRVAGNENIPSVGLIATDYHEKESYKRLYRLIREEWTTAVSDSITSGVMRFRGFYGKYKITLEKDGDAPRTFTLDFAKNSPTVQRIWL